MKASNTSLKIASNTQTRAEATAAVQQVIDQIMSTTAFIISPTSVAGLKPVDINNDGLNDYDVNLAVPVCISSVPIKNSELKPLSIPEDVKCQLGGDPPPENSLCSNTRWDITASATDPISGASVTIHQGVGVRVAVASCP